MNCLCVPFLFLLYLFFTIYLSFFSPLLIRSSVSECFVFKKKVDYIYMCTLCTKYYRRYVANGKYLRCIHPRCEVVSSPWSRTARKLRLSDILRKSDQRDSEQHMDSRLVVHFWSTKHQRCRSAEMRTRHGNVSQSSYVCRRMSGRAEEPAAIGKESINKVQKKAFVAVLTRTKMYKRAL